MGRNSTLRIVLALVVSAMVLSGCAGTARGIKSSVYEPDEKLSVLDVSKSQADAMVVIRYPAVVDQDALPAYYRSFEQNAIGGKLKLDNRMRQDTDRIGQIGVAVTAYHRA